MWTFIISVVLLVGGFFLYCRVAERVFGPDGRKTPAISSPDGVDKTPLPKWKAFLIELLNIAGTGPIFGAISGAIFGPIVFLWIVFGCLLGGAVHDYFTGMISSRNDGNSIVYLAGKYIGKWFKVLMTIFSILLLVLVTAVFVVSPASLLSTLTNGKVKAVFFLIIILAYYLIATIFPIDKIIGNIYPFFGIILLVMAGGVVVGLFINHSDYPMLELIGNLRDFSKESGGLPWWPFMFTTVACGAVSGFHATQSPIISKCIKTEKEGRQVFYGAMVAEGLIALVWAAAAITFFNVDTRDGALMLGSAGGGNSSTVYRICSTLLGPVGSVLAIVGVILCPISSGDTSLRSCRLILSEILHLDQKKIRNRLIITLPLFAVIVGISLWNFLDPANFNLLWRWFAWSNQVLAAIALVVCTAYLVYESNTKLGSMITALPMAFMIAVDVTFILGEPEMGFGKWIPLKTATFCGCFVGLLVFFGYLHFLHTKWKIDKLVIARNRNVI